VAYRRIWAFIVDAITYAVLASPALYLCVGEAFANRPVEGSSGFWTAYAVFVGYTGLEVITGFSVGKSMVDLRILNGDGRPASLAQRLARWVVKYFFVQIMFVGESVGLVDYGTRKVAGVFNADLLMPLCLVQACCSLATVVLTAGSRSIHDLCAGTAVGRLRDRRGFPALAARGT
jgi:uncharacterized RDD family membrane protein YckC